MNTYLYAMANSVMFSDPEGFYTLWDAEVELYKKFKKVNQGSIFQMWLNLESEETAWLAKLPKCPKKICLRDGGVEHPDPDDWYPVSYISPNPFHGNAVYELRSKTVGHSSTQCTYDELGKLYTSQRPEAGTADLYSVGSSKHTTHDVLPYVSAVALGRVNDYYTVRPTLY